MAALRSLKDLVGIATEISSWLSVERYDSLRLECMNGLGIYTTTVQVDNVFAKWVNKLGTRSKEFPVDQVYDVKMFALKPPGGAIKGAVYREGNRIIVNLKRGLDFEMFRLEIAYRMEEEWLRSLVHARSSPEPLKEALKYHLSAQLTDPSSLALGFKAVDVEEYPITARVHIQENINTAAPVKTLMRLREIEGEILSEYNPRAGVKILRLQRERARLAKRLKLKEPQQAFRDLISLIRPTNFMEYLTAEQDFRLHTCEWGIEVFKVIGALSLPKAIEVISRTDLSLDKPAARGILTYDSERFSRDVGSILLKMSKYWDEGARLID